MVDISLYGAAIACFTGFFFGLGFAGAQWLFSHVVK